MIYKIANIPLLILPHFHHGCNYQLATIALRQPPLAIITSKLLWQNFQQPSWVTTITGDNYNCVANFDNQPQRPTS